MIMPARIHRDDLVIKAREAPLILGDQLRIEAAFPVTRNRNGQLRCAGQNRLLRSSIAPVANAFFTLRTKMLIQFRIQNAFRKRLLQIIQQAVLGKQFPRIAASQKLVQ